MKWAVAEWLLKDGSGYIAVTLDEDPEEDYGGHFLRLRRFTAAGHLDPNYGIDGVVQVARRAGDGTLDLEGITRNPTDGSIMIASRITDSDELTQVLVFRVSAEGKPDEGYLMAQNGGLRISQEGRGTPGSWAMTVLDDGSVRMCIQAAIPSDGIDIYGLTPHGGTDSRVGRRGLRHNALLNADCTDILADPRGNLIVLALDRVGSGAGTVWSTSIETLNAHGGPSAPVSPPSRLEDFAASRLRQARDGSLFVCGSRGGDAYVARASSAGKWQTKFGDSGLALISRASSCSALETADEQVLLGTYRQDDPSNYSDVTSTISVISLDGRRDLRFANDGTLESAGRFFSRFVLDDHRNLVILSYSWSPTKIYLERSKHAVPV